MATVKNFGLFQWVTQKYYNVVRQSFNINKPYFNALRVKHYKEEFTSKYNENLFVDQDKNSGKSLINEILFNRDHFRNLAYRLQLLEDQIGYFKIDYPNLKSLLEVEKIEINKSSKQYQQLEFLTSTCENILKKIKSNNVLIEDENLKLPIHFQKISSSNLESPEEFNFEKLDEYKPEYRFIEDEPSVKTAVTIVFTRLSKITTQLKAVNKLVDPHEDSQIKIIHGNAGMGKSNFSAFVYSELRNQDNPAIIISGKSFNGDPDSFDTIFMKNLEVPKNYKIEEVLDLLNEYGKKLKRRVTIIIDGLNETSYAHDGFSKLWENSLDIFIKTIESYPYLYLVTTLRTSYISRIWVKNSIPYEQIELNGFKRHKLDQLILKYFKEYKINTETVGESDFFYFNTPLYLDLYCQMLNGDKTETVEPLLGMEGFKQVFDNYVNNLAYKTYQKLNLGTVDQVHEGIGRVSQAMIKELNAFVPKMQFMEEMQGRFIDTIIGSIGHEILQEYLIYLDENIANKDVIVHTQQEVGGYLIAKSLIADYGNVDAVVQSQFFQDSILGNSGHFHQLKDDILKFLIAESNANSLLYRDHVNLELVKKFTTLNLLRTKKSAESETLVSVLRSAEFSVSEVRTLINDTSSSVYDLEANINFLFIRDVLLKINNYQVDFSWTLHIYNNHYDYSEFIMHFINHPEDLEGNEKDTIIIELAIWILETTIRELRDKSTRFLLQYFSKHPIQILPIVIEYSSSNRTYIMERLSLVCYGVCLRLQNNESFIQDQLNEIASSLYTLQFSAEPSNPTYNYIVIDSYKHIIDLAILKGVFELNADELDRLSKYLFNKYDWFEITDEDRTAVPIANNWGLSTNPDPLAGDFVHYTIPRLDNRDYETRLDNTANIYKEIIRLGYVSDDKSLNDREQSFYFGTSLIGGNLKVDRLGKKYSWIAYFNYAGNLLNQNKLGVWSEEDSSFEKHYNRLSDTEIEPSYVENKPFAGRVIQSDFFEKRALDDGRWVNAENYNILDSHYVREEYSLLYAFVDQKLDEKFKTRSWVQANSYFVNKDQVLEHIAEIENTEFGWNHDLHGSGSLSKVYFGELYWADNIPTMKKDSKSIPLPGTKEITRKINHFEVRESGKFNFEDVGKEVTETVNDTCYFEYEPTLIDFLWESDSKQIPSLRCDVPAPNIGKHLKLTVDSVNTKILDSNLELCFKEYFSEYELNSEKFQYFRTDLLEKYLVETNQILMYQLKQHTYDQATDAQHNEHFRGMQFVFSPLNR